MENLVFNEEENKLSLSEDALGDAFVENKDAIDQICNSFSRERKQEKAFENLLKTIDRLLMQCEED